MINSTSMIFFNVVGDFLKKALKHKNKISRCHVVFFYALITYVINYIAEERDMCVCIKKKGNPIHVTDSRNGLENGFNI